MENKHFQEKSIFDAPTHLSSHEALAWTSGYNTALEKTAAPQLLEALRNILKWSAHFPPAMNEEVFSALSAIKKAKAE